MAWRYLLAAGVPLLQASSAVPTDDDHGIVNLLDAATPRRAPPATAEPPRQPAIPASPATPASPLLPVMSAYPMMPAYPAMPTFPMMAYPMMPAYPMAPAYPAAPAYAAMPTFPKAPAPPATPVPPVPPLKPDITSTVAGIILYLLAGGGNLGKVFFPIWTFTLLDPELMRNKNWRAFTGDLDKFPNINDCPGPTELNKGESWKAKFRCEAAQCKYTAKEFEEGTPGFKKCVTMEEPAIIKGGKKFKTERKCEPEDEKVTVHGEKVPKLDASEMSAYHSTGNYLGFRTASYRQTDNTPQDTPGEPGVAMRLTSQ